MLSARLRTADDNCTRNLERLAASAPGLNLPQISQMNADSLCRKKGTNISKGNHGVVTDNSPRFQPWVQDKKE
jgi:hypothetical protein